MEKKMAENEKKQEKNACVTIYLHWCQVYVNGVSYYFYPPKKKKKAFFWQQDTGQLLLLLLLMLLICCMSKGKTSTKK